MPDTLLRTKLFAPRPRSNLVSRLSLIERLDQGLHLGHKLTLISAPAGFGKTTLVSEWITGSQRPSAWLSLDEEDNDPTRFLTYLIAALQTAAPGEGEGLGPAVGERALAMLHAPQQPPTEMILTELVNDIAALPDDIILVLDDYHLIDTRAVEVSTSVDGALAFLLTHLPPQLHLVIATREDLDLPLAGMRGRGQLTELRATDLRFTTSEAADFLNQVMGLDLSTEAVDALEARTEGWITGLQLAALSMRGSEDVAAFIESFTGSHRFVLDYLIEEVLHQQPESVQTFLLQTAVLDRLTGPLCDAVRSDETVRFDETQSSAIGTATGQETLEMLERANLFIIPLDEERRWYRYHHLFADLLRQRLRQDDPELIPQLHGRASVWYEENSLLPQAIHEAFAAGDIERAAALVEKAAAEMENTFQSAVWLSWVRALPEELIRARPVLCVQVASALIDCGELGEVEQWLRHAERWLEIADRSATNMIIDDEAAFQVLPATIALNHANLASHLGDNAGAVKYGELALELIPEEDLMLQAQAVAIIGLTSWALGDLQAARHALVNWMDSTLQMGIPLFTIASAFGLADILVAQGRLQEAISTYDEALQLAQDVDQHLLPITAHHHLGLAMLYHEMGEEEKAAHHLQTSSDLGRKSMLIDWPYRRRLAHAHLKESAGDLDAALALLDEAKRVYITNPVPDVRPVGALKAGIYLKQGRLQRAQEWAREQDLAVDDELSYLHEFEHLTLTKVLFTEYSETGNEDALQQAGSLLERLLKAAEEGNRAGSVIQILIQQALTHQPQSDMTGALAPLERALSLAELQGYLRIFVDEGPPMARLLREANARGIASSYTQKLLANFSAAAEGDSPQSALLGSKAAAPPHSEFMESLSDRELEVLQLIAEGLTNQQIADRLYLSVNTVKVHTRNIYSKLDAHHRTQAVARAKSLGILPSS